jgi:predicted Fe-S protein YdhL (DUF1289 family)
MTAESETAGGREPSAPGAATAIASPCVRICVVDGASGLCLGCLRSLPEIARWGTLSARERADLMAVLPGRKALVDPAKLALVR